MRGVQSLVGVVALAVATAGCAPVSSTPEKHAAPSVPAARGRLVIRDLHRAGEVLFADEGVPVRASAPAPRVAA